MNLYPALLRPVLFGMDAERAHTLAIDVGRRASASRGACALLEAVYGYEHPSLATRVGGLALANPVGLPAGFDKNGLAAPALAALGFGMLDIGSVSLHSSTGNPDRPRLFRLPADRGIKVFYGVPNDGVDRVVSRLAAPRPRTPLGVSLVETNTGVVAPVDAVIAELVEAARRVRAVSDYRVLNLNCPNSAGGRSHFDDPVHLHALLAAIQEVEGEGPVFLRMTPPRDPETIDALLAAIDPHRCVRGIAFYTTPPDLEERLVTPPVERARMRGSFSGPANRSAAEAAIAAWYARLDRKRLDLIGVGGIFSAEDAYRSIRLGASAVQVYTALVYRGPAVVGEIKRGLAALLRRDGFASVAEAVGADAPQGRREH